MIALDSREVHVWLAYCRFIDDAGLLAGYRSILSPQERWQERRYRFHEDRHRYLVTRALVRTTLSRYAAKRPGDWEFSANPYGRPELVNIGDAKSKLNFNVSHTHGLVVLAISRGVTVGIDVENIYSRRVSPDIARAHFAPEEVAAISATAPNEQQQRFFEFWTLKESYIKARGLGLSIPLNEFRFSLDRYVNLNIDKKLEDDAECWQFWQFQPTSEYLIATCARRTRGADTNLVLREAIPGVFESFVTARFLRNSP